MKQKAINFRELLERVLPLDELPAADRLRMQSVLRAGIATQIEEAALDALAKLEQRGALRRIPPTAGGSARAVRYQPRDTIDVISVERPGPREYQGVLVFARAALPAHVRARLDQVRKLLHLEDPLLESDPRRPDARTGLIERLNQAGREFLGASELRFIPKANGEPGSPSYLDPTLAREACAHPELIYYCPDTDKSLKLEAEARRRRFQSVVVVGVAPSQGESLGFLEVLSTELDPFGPEELSLVALLADACAGVLERAARIEKLVFIDPLTSAYNRSYFDLQLQNEMARAQREQSSMALCIVDIDNFKSFNTAYGYEAGNRVLIQVAHTLRGGVRPFDTVARWGGEEFAVLLTAPVQAQDVATISERLRALVERHTVELESLDRKNHRVGVTVSIGVALFPDDEQTAADLWRAANQALLKAKRPPKNQVVFYRAGDSQPTTVR